MIHSAQAQKECIANSDEEESEEVSPQNRSVFQRDHYYTLDTFLLSVMTHCPKEGVTLTQLCLKTGIGIKQITSKMRQLENRGTVVVQMRNEGRKFMKFYLLKESESVCGV